MPESDLSPKVVAVLIDGAADRVFDYAVPGHLQGRVVPGSRVKVPLRRQVVGGTVIDLKTEKDAAAVVLRDVAGVYEEAPLLTAPLLELARWMSDYYLAALEQVIRAMVPGAARDGDEKVLRRKMVEVAREWTAEEWEKLCARAPKQAMVLEQLQENDGSLALAGLPGGAAAVRALEKKGWVKVTDQAKARDPYADIAFVRTEPPVLSADQQPVVERICEALKEPAASRPFLLYGVTGSGKTEIYLRVIERCMAAGKGAIVLVPEIALTPQTVERFKSRFEHAGSEVAVLHSHLSDGERFDEWRRIRDGRAKVVVGARSAVFAPVRDLGVIVVDEEHETSYKQESPPRYQARDIAVLRGRMEGAVVVLGSATPSLESHHNTQEGKYEGLHLPCRIDDRVMPLVRVVDMRIESRKRKDVAIFSEVLRQAMEKRLERGEQTILFLNRRGFSNALQCPACGHVCQCSHCSVSLTYHRDNERLLCHICGYQSVAPQRCPACSDPSLKYTGYGTQRVEEVTRKVFPKAKVARLDADATRRKHALEHTLRDFRTGKIDIVIGTQMIAKGLDFPNVTLVGVLNADLGLHMPDFRAGERTFQLLTQVAGRAGRGDLAGEVVVQTFTPHSPSVQFARHHDYEGFSSQELEFRRAFAYPPYTRLVQVWARGRQERMAQFTLENFARRLKAELPEGAMMGEPLPAPLVRAKDQFRFQLLIRTSSVRPVIAAVRRAREKYTLPDEIHLGIDVDSYQLG